MNLEHFSIFRNSNFLNSLKFILLIFLVKVPLESRSQIISPQVINVSGMEYKIGLDSYSFSLGESFITTLESDFIITQGFLQPKHLVPCAEFTLIAYPNPTTGILNLKFEGCDDKVRKIMLVDVFGKVLYNNYIPGNQVDLRDLTTGIFLLKAFNIHGRELGVVKIAKVNKL